MAGNADATTGYILEVNNGLTSVGGTSGVAPLWAALVAKLNEKLDRPVGFLNPLIYKIGSSSGAFRDIVEGNNTTAEVGGYQAGEGWDACTGLGSPNGENLLDALSE